MSPDNLSIFHITAIPNLAGLAAQRHLLAKNVMTGQGLGYANIAYQSVQGRRANKAVTAGKGGVLHDYVPFYFAPRSPMLRAIDGGRVEGCSYRQDDIVHLRASLRKVIDAKLPFVFYDINAAVFNARCFDDLAHLGEIDWELFFERPTLDGYCKYWNNVHANQRYVSRMETRQAEFLIHTAFPLNLVDEVVVRTQPAAAAVQKLVRDAGWHVNVRAQPLWYF
ncbi:UNVERIFIED_ORG: hypothetical protein M2438_001917 [Methylobacterium sp. SuP10 SLI 274]|uniref:type II toxin-antitoxin system toxin DNA ADP-ribosyl transferase DarT n=1 Tax=Methylorubrum extorquens TaxID=408 RepID=UPI00209FF49B|nr:DUF4433 domain-containing protein [Methylorubrum extorquens]MDF9863130.1 hypothetical protein [Methylorubrum pseudosasae]MDH6636742.1 hypothetical protein [Methylobacterium sp. SuP10 SLI 274]MDH6665919.1 hypothetical protein [Methylorubrum zatmanii]MCP1557833.1 hypothetical protein [Methylorubrum extorquens]MDF9791435.1 hypothetical protein [Methylorubrum extorquens]